MPRGPRRLAPLLASLSLFAACPALASWVPNGAPVCTAAGNQSVPLLAADGAGGVYVVWTDARSTPAQAFVQHLTSGGDPRSGWPLGGAPVASGVLAEAARQVVPDGSGGALVTWDVSEPNGTILQMLQRISPGGIPASGWPAGGVLCDSLPSTGSQSNYTGGGTLGEAPDGNGGAFVLYWVGHYACLGQQCSGSAYEYALHFNGLGVRDWSTPGKALGYTPLYYPGGGPGAGILGAGGIADGSGGLYAEGFGYQYGNALSRFNSASTTLWAASFGSIYGRLGSLSLDGAGGAYLAWDNMAGPIASGGDSIHVLHWSASGALVPGWPAAGRAIGLAGTDGNVLGTAPDGTGGVLVFFSPGGSVLLASRLLSNGTLAPGWVPGGNSVCPNPGTKSSASMVPDGQGGAFFAWTDTTVSHTTANVLAVHLDGSASLAPGWAATGNPVCLAPGGQSGLLGCAPGPGLAVFAWQDGRNGLDTDVYALQLPFDQAVAVQVSVARAEAGPDGAHIEWLLAGSAGGPIRVQRSRDGVEWASMAAVSADASGWVRYDDRLAWPGARLEYRLSLEVSGRPTVAGETWITMPAVPRLALLGCTPNPARGWPTVTLALPDRAPAVLELIDAAGRRVAAEAVGDLGVGAHAVRLMGSSVPPPGVYLVRLRQGPRAVSARALILR